MICSITQAIAALSFFKASGDVSYSKGIRTRFVSTSSSKWTPGISLIFASIWRRSDEIAPMLASRGGFSIFIGVGATRMCNFKRRCDGELSGVPIVVTVDEAMADRRTKYEQTGDAKHLEYENAFKRELAKKGRINPKIRHNFYLEDTVEEGNFVSRERLLSCARGGGV